MQEIRPDIQEIILSGYGHLPQATYLFLEFQDALRVRQWLRDLVPIITSVEEWPTLNGEKQKPQNAVHLAFSHRGLRALGLLPDTLASFPPPFVQDVAARAKVLGDTGDSSPEHWDLGAPHQAPLHAALLIYGATRADADALFDQQQQAIAATNGAIVLVASENGYRRPEEKEHFGFHDGISQPEIDGLVRQERGPQEVVVSGEFILGHMNAYDLYPVSPVIPEAADPARRLPAFPDGALPGYRDFGRNGSYLVYRKLSQDVAGFWNFIERSANRQPSAMLQLAAKFVGRWPSGAAITLAPAADNPALTDLNAFLYMGQDPLGLYCPIGAHIRRANPRDSRVNDTPAASLMTSSRHRLIRRGMLYGAPLIAPEMTAYPNAPIGLRDDGQPRGLQFFCIGADIARQFEFVQQTWCNSAAFNAEFLTKDPLIGDNDGTGVMTLADSPYRRRIAQMPRFVSVKGSGYFFLPSITSLRYLSR